MNVQISNGLECGCRHSRLVGSRDLEHWALTAVEAVVGPAQILTLDAPDIFMQSKSLFPTTFQMCRGCLSRLWPSIDAHLLRLFRNVLPDEVLGTSNGVPPAGGRVPDARAGPPAHAQRRAVQDLPGTAVRLLTPVQCVTPTVKITGKENERKKANAVRIYREQVLAPGTRTCVSLPCYTGWYLGVSLLFICLVAALHR